LDVVLRTAGSLRELSERGRVVPELADPSIREVFAFSYRLMYRVVDDEVQILAIVHGARDFGTWLQTRRREADR
jgi:plasmid stabilization system protein ParE